MADVIMRRGPGYSLAQEVGDLARSALFANKPTTWLLSEKSGDDFGYDFEVTAFSNSDDGAQCAFNIQLKGTTQQKSRIENGTVLSHSFDVSTLNLWHRSGFAVLVVIVDLIDTQDPKSATVHFQFVNRQLDEILPTLPHDRKTVQLHVPKKQVVDRDLDILPVILPYLDELAEARRQLRETRRAAGTTSQDLLAYETGNTNEALSTAPLSDNGDIDELIQSSSDKERFQAAINYLRAGDYSRVLDLCPPPTDENCKDDPKASGISSYLRAKALHDIGQSDAARELTKLAASLLPSSDEIISAYTQDQLNIINYAPEGSLARAALLESLEQHTGLFVTCIKSKVLALNGDYDQARHILDSFPNEKTAITRIVISTIEREWERALSEIEESRGFHSLTPKQRLWIEIMEARAHFENALLSVPRPDEGDFIIPFSGFPQIDYSALRSAYAVSNRAMISAQRLGWPVDAQYVLDVYLVSSSVLGLTDQSMPLIASLGFARPEVPSIRKAVSQFAVQHDQSEIAIQLIQSADTAPKFKHESCVLAVSALKSGQPDKAFELVTDEFLSDNSSDDVYLSSLMVIGDAANSSLRTDLLEKIRARLKQDSKSMPYGAILEAATMVSRNLLKRKDSNDALCDFWRANGHPTVVAHHLLTNIDCQDTEEAALFVEVAARLEQTNSLHQDQLANYGKALITLKRIEDAIEKLRLAHDRFRQDPTIKSLLGIALELNGNSPEAFQIFEELLNEGKASETARRHFVEIAVRMGFFDKAAIHIRNSYAKCSNRERKLQLLNTLFQLLIAEGNHPTQAEEVAWEFGQQTDQSNEQEEGIFLQEYLFATMRDDITFSPERIQEFQARLEAYHRDFPNSKLLWRAEIPTEGPPEAILSALREAVGLTDEQLQAGITLERRMDRGLLQIPFSWRPRRFLRNVSDLFMLWEIRKKAPIERAALHFSNNATGYDRNIPGNLASCEAVISLTSLLLLDELGLLVLVLQSFEHIVIARSTLAVLQQARSSFSSGWGYEKATHIIKQLQDHFHKIYHPPHYLEAAPDALPPWHLEEKEAMRLPDRVYFSDDIIETYLVCSNDNEQGNPLPSIATTDFLAWADESANTISPKEVAETIGQMILMRIMTVTVTQRYFIASVPDALTHAENQEQSDAALLDATAFNSICDGIWSHHKPFDELVTHFSANMSYLITNTPASQETLIVLWIRWLKAIRFQEKPPMPPIQKLATAFLETLKLLNRERNVIDRLWRSFWTALQRGLGSELEDAEDHVAICVIGRILGRARAVPETEELAAKLFERAKIGLEPGTERENWFNGSYVEAVAKRASERD